MPHSSPRYMAFTGPSMNPTLKPGDMLYVVPYDGRKVRRGDVVAFVPPTKHSIVTHRVISVNSGRIRTLGDNNSQIDDYVLSDEDLIGRVVYALRKKRRLRIYGGILGRLLAVIVRSIRSGKAYILPLLCPLYNSLARSGFLRRYVFPRVKTRVVSFKRPAGVEKRLFIGRRVIGQYTPGNCQWKIKPPFRLLVDTTSLPQEDQDR